MPSDAASLRPAVSGRLDLRLASLLKFMRPVLVLACLVFPLAVTAQQPAFRLIEGSGGAPIALMEWGAGNGPGILFLHGFGFSAEFWEPQTRDTALDGFRMAAIDLRGHGASAKPWKIDELVPTRVWAEDVAAAIAAAGLERPIIVGWSYGGFVAMDYVRHFGIEALSGLVLVASPAGLTERKQPDGDDLPGGPEAYARAAQQRESLSLIDNLEGNRYLAEIMTAADLPDAVLEQWTAELMRIPVYVTRGLRQGRSLENRDLAGALTLPVAIAVGGKDRSMPFEALEAVARALPLGEYWFFEQAGHTVSTDATEEFNRRLAEFARRAAAKTLR